MRVEPAESLLLLKLELTSLQGPTLHLFQNLWLDRLNIQGGAGSLFKSVKVYPRQRSFVNGGRPERGDSHVGVLATNTNSRWR